MFNQATADEICLRLAEGKSLRSVCSDSEMPDPSTVLRWTDSDPVFALQYARARETGYRLLADEILEIADGDEMADHKRVRVDARKWMLSKMLPKVYGDKVETTHTGTVTVESIRRTVFDPVTQTVIEAT